jgi:hypothetical protein
MSKTKTIIIICACIILTGCTSTNYSCKDSVEPEPKSSKTNSATIEATPDTDYYIISYCNLYDSSNNKIANLSIGDKVQSQSSLPTDTQVQVIYNNEIGYINSEYLESTESCYIDSIGTIIKSVQQDETIYKSSDTIGENLLNYAYNYWYIIPETIRQDFKQNNWKIELTNTSLSEEYNLDYNILAITLPDEQLIKIQATQSNIRNSLIHEVGHYVDYTNNYISESNQWKEAKSNELQYLDTTIESKYMNNKEYFAESFRVYCSSNCSKQQVLMNNTMKLIKTLL